MSREGERRGASRRRDFARRMTALAHVSDSRVEAAFAAVRREDFLGTPPWTILDPEIGAVQVAGDDPAPLYDDVLVSLNRDRGLNNGSPSLHTLMLHRLAVGHGDLVLHVGAGAGYYSAILAELTGGGGRVIAVEFDAALAERARHNLRDRPNVTVVHGDGADWPRETTTRIYVNAAVADLPERWLDLLRVGGTILVPLGVCVPWARSGMQRNTARGGVLLLTRAPSGYAVRHLTACAFVCAEGTLGGTPEQQDALHSAFAAGGIDLVRSLIRGAGRECWYATPKWCLSRLSAET